MTNLKYELVKLDENSSEYVSGLRYRIKSLRNFNDVKKGDLGGFVTDEDNLSQDGNCWLYDNSEMHNNSRIYNDAQMHNDSKMHDISQMYANTRMCNNSQMFNHSKMHNNSAMFDDSEMHDNAQMHNDTQIHGDSKMFDISQMFNGSVMFDYSEMHDSSKMFHNSGMFSKSKMHDKAKMFNNSRMFGNSEMFDNSQIIGYAKVYENAKLRKSIILSSYKYRYHASYYYSNDVLHINMGCYIKVEFSKWVKNFRNNTGEFPINSQDENDRLRAFNHIMLDVNKPLMEIAKDGSLIVKGDKNDKPKI